MIERTETTTDVPQTGWQRPELSEELLAEVKLHTTSEKLAYSRVHNGLLNMGVRTKEDILRIGREAFLRYPGLGRKTAIVIGKIIGEDWSPVDISRTSACHIVVQCQNSPVARMGGGRIRSRKAGV